MLREHSPQISTSAQMVDDAVGDPLITIPLPGVRSDVLLNEVAEAQPGLLLKPEEFQPHGRAFYCFDLQQKCFSLPLRPSRPGIARPGRSYAPKGRPCCSGCESSRIRGPRLPR